jgi:HPr kinase/phosphorylase
MKSAIHGTLVMVHGVGVLITGEPAIGKSETALTLVRFGHSLVADDKVDVEKVNNFLVGSCPAPIYGFIELRGIGIVDVHEIYGQKSIHPTCHIDLIVHLSYWEDGKTYDRFGEIEHFKEVLGVEVPFYEIPVKVGRNIPTILETLALHQKAKNSGKYAYHTLNQNVKEYIDENKRNNEAD